MKVSIRKATKDEANKSDRLVLKVENISEAFDLGSVIGRMHNGPGHRMATMAKINGELKSVALLTSELLDWLQYS